MHRKNRKGKKKLPISVFPTSVECHRQVFFFHITTLKIRKHTRYVAPGCGVYVYVCVSGFLRACMYMDEYGSNQFWCFFCFCFFFVLALLSLFQKSFLKSDDVFVKSL